MVYTTQKETPTAVSGSTTESTIVVHHECTHTPNQAGEIRDFTGQLGMLLNEPLGIGEITRPLARTALGLQRCFELESEQIRRLATRSAGPPRMS